jgi:hypothetical protein
MSFLLSLSLEHTSLWLMLANEFERGPAMTADEDELNVDNGD